MGAVSILSAKHINKIEEIIVDVTIEETHTFKSKVTQFPVENGVTISDHIFNEPITVSMQGFVTNSPIDMVEIPLNNADLERSAIDAVDFTAKTQVPSKQEAAVVLQNAKPFALTHAEDALIRLLQLRENRTPVTIITGLFQYTNMVMTSLVVPRNTKTANALYFTADFTKIVIVSTSTVPITSLKGIFNIDKVVAKKSDNANATPQAADTATVNETRRLVSMAKGAANALDSLF